MRIFRHFAAVAVVSLAACSNYNLLNRLENPGSGDSANGGQNSGITVILYLFPTSTSMAGNLKGAYATAREGADQQCIGSRAALTFPDNRCNQVRAFISLSSTDSIANMPGNYGIPTNQSINAPNNFTLASDWNTLIAGSSGNSLAPNVMPAATAWWSFSEPGGTYDTVKNCSGGGDGSSGPLGSFADSSATGAAWLANNSQNCDITAFLVCICF